MIIPLSAAFSGLIDVRLNLKCDAAVWQERKKLMKNAF
jgi:hypothetical protein